MYYVKNFDKIHQEEWDAFVQSSSKGWLWHAHNFIISMSGWEKHSNQSFALCDEREDIVGIFPLYLIENKVLRIFCAPLLTNIGGWLSKDGPLSSEISQILINEFFKKLKKYFCLNGSINFATASINYKVDPLFTHGISGQRAYSSVIDLTQPIENIWKNFRKGHKSEIKKAENKKITFRRALPEDLDCYYKMHEKVCAKSSIPSHSKSYFDHIFNIHLPQKNAFIGVAYLENEPIAMVNYGIYKSKAVYWTGACFDVAYQTGANHFLHWYMMNDLVQQKITHLDMGEVFCNNSSAKIQGIANFKLGFGGELFPIYKACQNVDPKWLKIYRAIQE